MLRSRVIAILSLFLGLLVTAGCAKISEPVPPRVLVSKPATDLNARQSADRILLTVSMPTENTDGSSTLTLGEVEIFRLAGDRRSAGPLPPDTYLVQAERVQAIPAETLGRYLKDGKLNFMEGSEPAPDSFYRQGFLFAVRFVNRKNQTAGLSNQAFIAPVPIPAAPSDISATLSRETIRLEWKPPAQNLDGSTPARIGGYNVYRSDGPKTIPASPLNEVPLSQSEYVDRNFQFDRTYSYSVTVVGSRENPYAESLPSAPLEVAAKDVFPPGMPKNLNFVVDKGVVTLLWSASDDTDIAGYRVYRTEEGSIERILLQEPLVTTLSYRDDTARPGKKYQYGVAAVDTHKNEGQAAIVLVEVQ
jgi:hypothetical protein